MEQKLLQKERYSLTRLHFGLGETLTFPSPVQMHMVAEEKVMKDIQRGPCGLEFRRADVDGIARFSSICHPCMVSV